MIGKYFPRSQDCDTNFVEYVCVCGKRVKQWIYDDGIPVSITTTCKCGVVTTITEFKITSFWEDAHDLPR